MLRALEADEARGASAFCGFGELAAVMAEELGLKRAE